MVSIQRMKQHSHSQTLQDCTKYGKPQLLGREIVKTRGKGEKVLHWTLSRVLPLILSVQIHSPVSNHTMDPLLCQTRAAPCCPAMRERSECALVGSNVTLSTWRAHSSFLQQATWTAYSRQMGPALADGDLEALPQELTNKHRDCFGSQYTANNCGFTTQVLMWWFQLRNSNTISRTPGMHLDVFITMTGQVPLCSSLPLNGSVVPDERRLSGKVSRGIPGEEYRHKSPRKG